MAWDLWKTAFGRENFIPFDYANVRSDLRASKILIQVNIPEHCQGKMEQMFLGEQLVVYQTIYNPSISKINLYQKHMYSFSRSGTK